MSRFLCWSLVVLWLGVFGAVVVFLLRERTAAGLSMPAYSVYSEADDGLGEAAQVLRRLGWTPVALTRPIQQTRHRGLLVLAEPRRTGPLGDDEGGISD